MIFLVGVDLRVLWYLVQILTEVGPCVSAFGADQQPRNVSKIRCIDTKAESMILWVGVYLRVPRYLVQLLTEVGLCVGAIGADQREEDLPGANPQDMVLGTRFACFQKTHRIES